MKRLSLLTAGVVVLLVFASTALAAYAPKLTVNHTLPAGAITSTTDIGFSQTDADDPTASVVIYSPVGYTVALNQPVGTQIGTLDGSVVAGAFGGATVPVTGTVTVGDRTNTNLTQAAEQCTGRQSHDAIWLLNVTAAGQSLPNPVPVYVDLTTTLPFSAFASASLQLCLPHPSQAAFGIKLLSATLHMTGVFTGPATAGNFAWTAVNVPWKDSTQANLLGTVETQAVDPNPLTATITAKLVTKTRKVKHKTRTDIFYSYSAKIGGQVRQGTAGAAGVSVDIMVGDEKVATATTDQNGSFSKTLKLARTTGYHLVYTLAATALPGAACNPVLPLGGQNMPCANVTSAGFTATTGERTVKKPKLTVRHIKKKPKKKRPKH
jgi:hypothetical protein